MAYVASERIRPVDALEGVNGDRQRSLQQDLGEIAPGAIGDFHGAEQVMQGARNVATQLVAMGKAADGLIKPSGLKVGIRGVDESA
jgi:hypothetical protein